MTYGILALMAAFYTCYFGKMLRQRQQGIQTDQLGRGKSGKTLLIEVSLKAASCLLPVGQLVSLHFYKSAMPLQIAGLILTAAGVSAFVLSVLQMKDNWRAGVQESADTALVTSGIYSVSRNPAFLGFDLMYIGILLHAFNAYLLIATLIALILFHLQITKVEEPFLVTAFGSDYARYKKTVCLYIGRRLN